MVGNVDGTKILRSECLGEPSQAHSLGTQLAENLLAQGAASLLEKNNYE